MNDEEVENFTAERLEKLKGLKKKLDQHIHYRNKRDTLQNEEGKPNIVNSENQAKGNVNTNSREQTEGENVKHNEQKRNKSLAGNKIANLTDKIEQNVISDETQRQIEKVTNHLQQEKECKKVEKGNDVEMEKGDVQMKEKQNTQDIRIDMDESGAREHFEIASNQDNQSAEGRNTVEEIEMSGDDMNVEKWYNSNEKDAEKNFIEASEAKKRILEEKEQRKMEEQEELKAQKKMRDELKKNYQDVIREHEELNVKKNSNKGNKKRKNNKQKEANKEVSTSSNQPPVFEPENAIERKSGVKKKMPIIKNTAKESKNNSKENKIRK